MTHLPTGAYRPGDSIVHGLDAAVKLICFFLLLLAVLTTDTPAGYAGMLLFTVAVAYLAQLGKKRIFGGLRPFWWLMLLVALSNFAFYAPGETFGAWWVFTPSYKGLYKGVCIALRVAMLLTLANALSSTTSSLRLLRAFETVLFPLTKLKIPVERFVAALQISSRLIPDFFEDAELIRRVQKARGVNFRTKGFFSKAETALPLILPLLITSFRRADDMSLVMEARGFKSGQNAFPVEMPKLAVADWSALLVCAAVCAMQIIIF